MIKPRTLKGFRDYLPEAMIPRERLIDTARRVYRSYGFSPIDTPALEYLEILTGQGGRGDRQAALPVPGPRRPLGRHAVRPDRSAGPLRRSTHQPTGHAVEALPHRHRWRGENTQRGRYREFMQCDFDTIGTRRSPADIETALVIHDLFRAIGFDDFHHPRQQPQVLTGLLETARPGRSGQLTFSVRWTSSPRSGATRWPTRWSTRGLDRRAGRRDPAAGSRSGGTNDEILRNWTAGGRQRNGRAGRGRRCIELVAGRARRLACQTSDVRLDVSIARGLDYYTGTVFETFLTDLPGSAASAPAAATTILPIFYTKQELPGIGASLGPRSPAGRDGRTGMIEKVAHARTSVHPVLRSQPSARLPGSGGRLRAAGLGVEVFPEPKKLGQQLKYADRRGFRVALIAGDRELNAKTCQVKDLRDGSTEDVSTVDVGWVDQIKRRLRD